MLELEVNGWAVASQRFAAHRADGREEHEPVARNG
jgi:hypothetical protein